MRLSKLCAAQVAWKYKKPPAGFKSQNKKDGSKTLFKILLRCLVILF